MLGAKITSMKPVASQEENSFERNPDDMKASRLADIRALAEKHTGKGSKCVEMLLECVTEIERLQKRNATRGPSLAEVMAYATEIGLHSGEPEKFFDYHAARGWRMGKSGSMPMRDFKAALRTWKRNAARFCPASEKKSISSSYGVG